jgi:hypothetical protein
MADGAHLVETRLVRTLAIRWNKCAESVGVGTSGTFGDGPAFTFSQAFDDTPEA